MPFRIKLLTSRWQVMLNNEEAAEKYAAKDIFFKILSQMAFKIHSTSDHESFLVVYTVT